MRHHNVNRKFGREKNQRLALKRSLARELVKRGKIRTTTARAKELRPFIERLVTKLKVNKSDLASRRLVIARLASVAEARTLAEKITPRYVDRPGGYTRITKLTPRRGDNSPMAVIEFV
ncbi:MAG: 50S ribosomal protein L17 [Patescibacteria group bacterium]